MTKFWRDDRRVIPNFLGLAKRLSVQDTEHEQEQEYEQETADALHVLDNVIAEL